MRQDLVDTLVALASIGALIFFGIVGSEMRSAARDKRRRLLNERKHRGD